MCKIKEFEVWFDDLKPKVQKQLLKACKVKSPDELNWDGLPMFTMPIPEPELEDK